MVAIVGIGCGDVTEDSADEVTVAQETVGDEEETPVTVQNALSGAVRLVGQSMPSQQMIASLGKATMCM